MAGNEKRKDRWGRPAILKRALYAAPQRLETVSPKASGELAETALGHFLGVVFALVFQLAGELFPRIALRSANTVAEFNWASARGRTLEL